MYPFDLVRRGNHELITREYFEAKTKYESINKSMKNLKKYHKVSEHKYEHTTGYTYT